MHFRVSDLKFEFLEIINFRNSTVAIQTQEDEINGFLEVEIDKDCCIVSICQGGSAHKKIVKVDRLCVDLKRR